MNQFSYNQAEEIKRLLILNNKLNEELERVKTENEFAVNQLNTKVKRLECEIVFLNKQIQTVYE